MAKIKIDKVVSVLPNPLIANTVYAVRVGNGFDLYISDSTGTVAHELNLPVEALNRANHIGTQLSNTISDFTPTVLSTLTNNADTARTNLDVYSKAESATSAQGVLADNSVQLTGNQIINGEKSFNNPTTKFYNGNIDLALEIQSLIGVMPTSAINSIIGVTQSGNGNVAGDLAIQARTGFGKIKFFANGLEKAHFDTNGNLAIGLVTATEKLHVSGNVKATDFLGNWNGNGVNDFATSAQGILAENALPLTGGILTGGLQIDSLDGLSIFNATSIKGDIDGLELDFELNNNPIFKIQRIGTNTGRMIGYQRSVNQTAANAPFYTFNNNIQSGMYLHKTNGELGLVANGFTVFHSDIEGNVTIGGNDLNNFIQNAGVTLRATINEPDILDLVDNLGARKGFFDQLGNLDIEGNYTGNGSTLDGILNSIVGGTDITIDNTDPKNPIINSIASGGGSSTQSDWEEANTSSPAFIVNKPENLSDFNDDIGVDNLAEQIKSPHLKKELHLFIGQSNMKSDNAGPVLINTDDAPDPRIFDVSRGITYEGKYAPAPVGEKHIAEMPTQNIDTPPTSNSVGMSLAFAKSRLALNDGLEEITYINSAVGNTGFQDNRWNEGDDLYNIAVDQVKDFLYKNPEYTLTSIQWHQGESDTFTVADANLYEGRLIAMIEALRKDFGYTVPFVLGTMRSDWIGTEEARLIVDQAHKNIPNLVALTSTVDMSDLTGIPNNVHFDAPSLRIAGGRYAEHLQSLMNSSVYNAPIKTYVANRSNGYKHVFDPTLEDVDDYKGVLVTGTDGKNTSMKFNGSASTKMAWIRPNSTTAIGLNKNIISGYKFSDLSGSLDNAHFFTSSSYGQSVNGGLNDNDSNFRATINQDLTAWHHVAITFDGINLRTYINAVETSVDGGTNNSIIDDGIINLGNLTFSGNTSNAFNLFMDDVRVYPFALTASQIGDVVAQDVLNKVDGKYDETDWGYYATNIKYTELTGTIPTGQVLTGDIDNVTVYRFISTSQTGLYPSEDSFYSTFDGTTLSDLITTR